MSVRAPLPAAALAAAAALALPVGASAITLDGGGFGHGSGLSQYGAYGFALQEGRDAAWIVGHYYPGTTLAPEPRSRVRVLLRQSARQTVCGATRVKDAKGRAFPLLEPRSYRVFAAGLGGLRLVDVMSGRTRSLRAPVRFTGGSRVCLRGRAINGVAGGSYRGGITIVRARAEGEVAAVNDVAIRHYLNGVVPAEMPSAWPVEAIKAQAIVARSYAVSELDPGHTFDVYADTRSQVYTGFGGETAAGTAAVLATDGLVVRYGDRVAKTLFSSSSGGVTANNEEVFPNGTPLAYLRSVPDPYDTISPYHAWSAAISGPTAQSRLGDAVQGNLLGLNVTQRGPSGRVLRVDVIGTAGTTSLSGPAVAARLQLRSSLFSVRAGG